MAEYVILESRDPFDVPDVQNTLALAAQLKKGGDDVTLFLVGSAVAAARPTDKTKAFTEVAQAGVKVLADDFSLRERGIGKPAIPASPIDFVVDALARGAKTLWR